MRRRAVFLDRDGVIIEDKVEFISHWADVEFLPGALHALQRLSLSDYALVLVTNQSGIGRGIITLEQAAEINRRLVKQIEANRGRIDARYMCPHGPNEQCSCRKPAPGMLFQAAEDLAIDLSRSYLIGDAVTDILAARAAGTHGIMVLTGRGAQQASLLSAAEMEDCPIVADLNAAVDYILMSGELASP